MPPSEDPSAFLRLALRSNAAFSLSSGLVLAAAAGPAAAFLGVSSPLAVAAVGVGLVVFAADLLRNAARPVVSLGAARLAIAGDLAWVAATALVLVVAPETFGAAGRWTAIAVADVVFAFALAQAWGVRRAARAAATP